MTAPTSAWMQIGELSARTGVGIHALRAWERRYGVLRPRRTDGGTRLYAPVDEARVQLMRRYLAQGMRAAEAAEQVASARLTIRPGELGAISVGDVARAHADLRAALDRFEETTARGVLEGLFSAHPPLAVIRDVLLPYMAELGRRWERGEADVSQEHFATQFLLARLLAVTRGWDRGLGPRALLACGAGEQHTFGLIAFGVALHSVGWRVTYLGGETSARSLAFAARAVRPDLVVLAATMPGSLTAEIDELASLAAEQRMAIGGPSASAGLAERIGAEHLAGDAVTAATGLVGR